MENIQIITREEVESGISFEAYIQMIAKLLEQGQTTGTDHSAFMVEYTRLNMQRMRRLVKTTLLLKEVRETLDNLEKDLVWVVLTEGWCGDAAQVVPVIAELARYSPKIQLRLLLRDEHPAIMDAYLTNGTRSIPKLICFDAHTFRELGTWGPRPAAAQQLVQAAKSNPNLTKEDFIHQIHKWYADNKTLDTQQELLEKIKEWAAI